MKKTLIALLALGSTAMATDTVISNAGQTPNLFRSGGVVVTGGSLSSTMEPGTGTQPSRTDYRDSFTYAYGNIGSGAQATYTLNFTVESIADGTAARGMTIDFFSLNSGGAPQNNANGYDVNVSLRLNGVPVTGGSYAGTITTSVGNNHQSASAYESDGITINTEKSSYNQLTLSDVDWKAGDYILSVEITQAEKYKNGCFAGVGNVTLHASNVPEPTTGSLSLLALAGLCIRRRK